MTSTTLKTPTSTSNGTITSSRNRWVRLLVENINLLALIGLAAYFTIAAPNFLTSNNLTDILIQVAPLAVIAVPLTYVIISGYLDLSVGSTLAVSAVVAGQLMVANVPWPVAVLVAILVGTAIGALNGFLIAVLGFSTIIVTLGTLTAGRGLALAIGPDPIFGFPQGFTDIAQSRLVGIPYLVIIALLVFSVGWFILNWTPFGRHVYATGINKRAAFLSGVGIRRGGFLIFACLGAAAGLAGVMFASRLGSTPAESLGIGYEVDVLTAVLLGGVAFEGGRGSLARVGLGILFLGVLANGLILMNVDTAWSNLIRGLILILAAGLVFLDRKLDRSSRV
ncbi:ABC transporter permease [Rhodococcus sp. NPDC055024]